MLLKENLADHTKTKKKTPISSRLLKPKPKFSALSLIIKLFMLSKSNLKLKQAFDFILKSQVNDLDFFFGFYLKTSLNTIKNFCCSFDDGQLSQ
ncbi:hypothetical protein BpHYR1_051537 [Brachionus plicatilis]|uniref:Uncharacterized protein n=1 Tax=Brachionus plicatilis TaxID=10195 RepID=A0A3M7SFG7_BRAPC|nr:hypothetical protein BpHYR1_051537 [Brachionus plicatilis]